MKRSFVFFIVALLLSATPVMAGLVSNRPYKPSPLIKRKIPSTRTSRAAASWTTRDVRVSNWSERRHDDNRDGYLQPNESKALLKDRYDAIRGRSSASIGSSVEDQYDFNNNNRLDKNEIAAIGADI